MVADPHALVGPYALDALDAADRRHFEQHLAVCDACWTAVLTAMEVSARLDVIRPRLTP